VLFSYRPNKAFLSTMYLVHVEQQKEISIRADDLAVFLYFVILVLQDKHNTYIVVNMIKLICTC